MRCRWALILPLMVGAAALTRAGAAAGAADEPTPRVRAELVLDKAEVAPGQTLRAGVLLRIDLGWHVYWINPGDSGMPTEVAWTLPAGMTASPLRYPVPVRFEQPGEMVGYGYEGEVLVWSELTVPRDAAAGSKLTIGAAPRWLVCKDICLAGRSALSATVTVAGEARPDARGAALLDAWSRRLPEPAAEAAESVSAKGALDERGQGTFTVEVSWKAAPENVEWFPAAGARLAVEDVVVATEGKRTTVTFSARALRGQKVEAGAELASVLAFVDEAGRRRGLSVPVVLRPAG